MVGYPIHTTHLPGTAALTESGDLAAQMVAGLHAYLDQALAAADQEREAALHAVPGTAKARQQWITTRRARLARVIGAIDARLPVGALEFVCTTEVPSRLATSSAYDVHAIRWPVLDGVDGEGLLLRPHAVPIAHVIALPDADWSPEMLVGLVPGVAAEAQFARRLAELGCQVIVPVLIDRSDTWSGSPAVRMTNQPHREFIYRMAFELGRHIIGYEVQKILALVDYFAAHPGAGRKPVAVYGYGEGGLLALHSAALDPRIAVVGVSGYIGSRLHVWQEPIYRNIWGLLRGFSDAELAALIAPRPLVVEATPGPVIEGPPPARNGRSEAAPGRLTAATLAEVCAEVMLARRAYEAADAANCLVLVEPDTGAPGPGSAAALSALLHLAGISMASITQTAQVEFQSVAAPQPDLSSRLHRQFDQLCQFTQRLLARCWRQRQAFWQKADATSVDSWQQTCTSYRRYFWEEVLGRCPSPSLAPNPRTRQVYDEPHWTGYDVVLDLWPEVFAYGLLLVPKGMEPGERRPVIVCQHGLEGRPQGTVEEEDGTRRRYAARLADQGYVVFAPQNPYIGKETFRALQRKAHPLRWSLFSFIIAQHWQALAWLREQPFVAADRIAFYGHSYGGKTAMRVPAVLEEYSLSICSGDFNEWVVKCASVDLPMSYMYTREHDIYEFGLGETFNYAEMAWLIAPRPFMVERGHRDGVGLDEWVAFEYAKVRRRYADLGIPDRTEIAFFDGGHMIHGQATFAFLDRHLRQ